MTQKKKTTHTPLILGNETFGQRLSRIRKEKGYTQVELAKKMGTIQVVISDYERDQLRPYYDTIIRVSEILETSADELLGIKPFKNEQSKLSLKITQRMKKIEALPVSKQKILLQNIDIFLIGIEAQQQ